MPDYGHPYHIVPCKRCGAADTSYADRVGDTRHERFKRFIQYCLHPSWWPMKCVDCGKRFGDHKNCVPF